MHLDLESSQNRAAAGGAEIVAPGDPKWEERFDANLGPFAEILMNALVVEDSPRISERLVELVSIPGQVEVVATAETEAEATDACNAHDIDLAIVDLQLAEGTGFGVIRALREAGRQRRACIVVLTNHAVPALRNAAFAAGADYFLDKSKDFATLPQLIDQLLAGRKN
jgi:two-component system, OmpR family, response regulator